LCARGANRRQLGTGEGDPGIAQEAEAIVLILFGHFYFSNSAGGSSAFEAMVPRYRPALNSDSRYS
jgi:hypothetical protein